jgi:hypothetical protein
MNVTIWEHCTFDSKIFGCGKIYYFNIIISNNLMYALVIVGLKKSSLAILALTPPKNVYTIFGVFIG